jgi:hypothetical protein
MFGVHPQRDRGACTEPGQQQAERSRTGVGPAVAGRFVAAQRMAPVLMRTPYGVSSLVTVAVATVWSRLSLITPSLIYARPLAAAEHAVLHAELRG